MSDSANTFKSLGGLYKNIYAKPKKFAKIKELVRKKKNGKISKTK